MSLHTEPCLLAVLSAVFPYPPCGFSSGPWTQVFCGSVGFWFRACQRAESRSPLRCGFGFQILPCSTYLQEVPYRRKAPRVRACAVYYGYKTAGRNVK